MANFYLDTSAVGNEYQAYADTPATWGVPQDGNGKAATGGVSAVFEIDCTSASASGTGTINVLGQNVSTTLNASGATLASAIVTAVNATATATIATYSALLLPVNKMVFARVKPTDSNVAQIMLRIAGADWNSYLPTQANLSPAATITLATTGVDGPFAYLVTNSTVFGKTAKTYGVLTASKVASVTDPGAATDVVFVRTMRSAANIEVTLSEANSYYTWTLAPASTNRQLVFDDGTKWAGDAGEFKLTISAVGGFTGGFSILSGVAATVALTSLSGKRVRLYTHIGSTYGIELRQPNNGRFVFDGVTIEESATSTNGVSTASTNSTNYAQCIYRNCKFIQRAARSLVYFGTNPSNKFQFIDCEFEYFGLTGNVSGLVVPSSGSSHDQSAEFIACKFYDRNGVYSVINPVASGGSATAAQRIVFDGCTGVDAVASNWTAQFNDYNRQLLWENYSAYRDWRIETGCWLAEWRYANNQPVLSSELPSGVKWSAKVLLRNTMLRDTPQRPLKITGFYRAATAVKTVTLEYLAQMAFKKPELGFILAYTDENDVVRYESCLASAGDNISGAGANCATSLADWVLNGNTGFTAYALSLTTVYPMKTNTEFIVYVVVSTSIASDQTLYFNGEVALA